MNDPFTFIFFVLIFGAITAAIAQKRNLGSTGGWFLFGALLFIVALPMAIFSKPGLPQAPPGMRAVKCPRCNAVQNIPDTQPEYECWQCKAVQRLWGTAPHNPPNPPDAAPIPPMPPLYRPPKAAPKQPSGKSTKVRCHHCQHVQTAPLSQQTFVCEECGTNLKRRTPIEGS